MGLVALEDVQREILGLVSPLDVVEVALADALGLALGEDVTTSEPVPPFANTAMDGYAVRAADTTGATSDTPVRLRVVGDLPAGHAADRAVRAGESIRIMTGAPMPPGADAIVIVERTARDGADGVFVEASVSVGDHVRPAGGDLEAGAPVFASGTVLRAAHLGVLASAGAARVRVTRRARVGVLSTGDELVSPATPGPLPPGTIRDSNRPMLLALVAEAGCEPVDLGTVADDEARTIAILEDATRRCDAVLTSGGVSMGEYDYVKVALERLGSLHAHQVAIKPAKPLAFGFVRGVPVFGLPGNPVSSLVSFECFARPALLARLGHPHRFRPEVPARAEHAFDRRRDGRLHLDRVCLRASDDGFVASRTGNQASNALAASAAANGLARVPDGDGVPSGGSLRVLRLDGVADH
jgi:molybdenum cofactor synthesis domain-containing protein